MNHAWIRFALRFYGKYIPFSRGKTRLIEAYYRMYKPQDVSTEKTRFGAMMNLDLSQYVERKIYFEGAYEFYLLRLMQKVNQVSPCAAMIDVGANVGQHSLFAALCMDVPNVFAFEPCATTYEKLLQNIKLNKLGNRIHSKMNAVSDQAKEFFMVISSEENQGKNYITEHKTQNSNDKVKAITLDQFLENKDGPFLLKIDVEGAEYAVLRGAKNYLDAHRFTAIFVEICPEHLKRFGVQALELLEFLNEAKYVGFWIRGNSLFPINNKKNIQDFNEAIFLPEEDRDRIFNVLQ